MGNRLDGSVWLASPLLDEMDGLWCATVASFPMSLAPGGCSLAPSSSSSDLSAAVPRKLRFDRVPELDLSTLQGVVSGSLPLEGLLSLVVCTALDDGQDRGSDRVLRLLYVLQRGSSVSPLDAPVTETITESSNQSSFDREDPYSRRSRDILWIKDGG